MILILISIMLTVSNPVSSPEPNHSLFGEEATAELALASTLLAPQSEGVGPASDDASPFSYTFVEVGATKLDVDSANDEADVYYLRGSLALGVFHVVASYANQDIDFQNTSADVLTLGAGAHFSLSPQLDLTGDVSWIYNDVSSDISSYDGSDSGFIVRAGPRWMPLDWDGGGLELNGEALYVDIDNRIASDPEAWGWGAGARLHFLRLFSVGLNYSILEDDDEVSVNARVSF